MAKPAAAPKPAVPPSRRLSNLKMVWRFTLRYPAHLAAAALSLLVAASATLFIPRTFQKVIDHGFGRMSDTGNIAPYFQGLLAVVLVLALATAFRFYFVSWLGERTVADIRVAVQANLLRLSPGFYEVNSPKEISSRMTSDTAIIENVVGTTVSVALRNSLTAIGGIGLLIYLAPSLTLGLLIGIPIVIAPIVFFGRKIRAVSRSSQDRIADVGAYVTEVLSAMKIVQSFGQERREGERFAGVVEETFAIARRRIVLRAVMTSLVILLVFGAITLAMWRGALAVTEGTITAGDMGFFVFTGILVAGALGSLTEVYGDLLRGAGAASRLAELLEAKPDIAPPARPERLPEPARGSLSFRNVTFRYPARPETAALRDFTLEIEPGETIENAVRRETREESGITVGRVRYHASQPWPMPHQLMIGCYGEATDFDIAFDTVELEDCRWFTRGEIATMLQEGSFEGRTLPIEGTIARRLIQVWFEWRH